MVTGARVVSIARPDALFEIVNRDDISRWHHRRTDRRLRRALEEVDSGT